MPAFNRQSFIEWRAGAIDDPIERLRYLRDALAEESWEPDEPRHARWKARLLAQRSTVFIAGSIFLGIVIASGYTVARGRTPPELRPLILPPPIQPAAGNTAAPNGVWLVDTKDQVETYSNGLRIDNRFAVSNTPRQSYRVFPLEQADLRHAEWQDKPAGIVFHTTESILAPFEPEQNGALQHISTVTLKLVRKSQSYHFVIDRFGRVFRVVRESDVAYHAGNSVWAGDRYVYVDLNTSFLGVAFETQSLPGQDLPSATPAQIDAARVLTELLRHRYGIPADTCVTHAQVSVNPANMLIGYHTDWADRFPYREMGLSDNYAQPPASIFAFGFDYDPPFLQSAGSRLAPALLVAEARARASAARRKVPIDQYKAILRANYKELTAVAKPGDAAKETANEEQ